MVAYYIEPRDALVPNNGYYFVGNSNTYKG